MRITVSEMVFANLKSRPLSGRNAREERPTHRA
jgi:hypothetical protein